MPLFPAYSTEDIEDGNTEPQGMVWEASEATESREAQLLASESEEEAPAARPASPQRHDDFYLDCKLDRGNLRVSTLYYPGRPQYERRSAVLAGGAGAGERARGRSARRYWDKRAPEVSDAPAATERAAAYRDLLLKRLEDVHLWEQYIDFEETCLGSEAALRAAEQAAERAPRSRRLRARLLAAARAALPRPRLLQRLQDLVVSETCVRRRTELWCALVEAAGAEGGAAGARAIAEAAVADTRAHAPAYPRLLHAYGVFLRTAGLWEELVLLVELVGGVAGALAPAAPAPPAPDALRRLRDAEESALRSGLPLPALWVRVERARAAAHWRPAPAADPDELAADPQRAPLAHELAELLRPVVGEPNALLLCVTLLRLAKVPLLPESGYVSRAWGAAPGDCAEALLPLLRAARRLPAAREPHRAAPARRLLAAQLDPPHYFTDDDGFLSWTDALWEACCGRVSGERRAALLCWRLRWLHALLLLVDPAAPGAAAEVSRIRSQARGALQRLAAHPGAAGAPLAYAQFARIELAASPDAAPRAARLAARALHAALEPPGAPPPHALHIARVVCEVSGGSRRGELSAAGARALVLAVSGRAPAAADDDDAAPPADELRDALQVCEERCAELERRYAEEAGAGEEVADEAARCLAALLPGDAEWGAARVLLAPPARRARLLRALPALLQGGRELSAAGERYYEQSACALVFAGVREHGAAARALSRLFPHNTYLALEAAQAPLWAWRVEGAGAGAPCAPRAPSAALAALLPTLLRAEAADWAPAEAEACARVSRRVAGAAGGAAGALLGRLRLLAETRAPSPRLPAALYDALDRTPHDKWLHVRGAASCGGEAGVLHDALMDKQLRAHALLDELAALVSDPH